MTSLPGCSPQAPFLALLHRLLSAGADLAARNNSLVLPTSHTPLGSLLCSSGHAGLVQPAAVDAAAAMLAAGASVTDAGGGRAWRSVLTSAFWYSGGTVGACLLADCLPAGLLVCWLWVAKAQA